jgi:hypothetical protein
MARNKIEIGGYCDEKFARVRDIFSQHFEAGQELGSSLPVHC